MNTASKLTFNINKSDKLLLNPKINGSLNYTHFAMY